jgi:predicted metal-dependent phosphoesterase TrpH
MTDDHRIQFATPNLEKLTRAYTAVDLHFHSQYSDGYNSVEEIIARARELGIGVAITDHNEIEGSVEIDQFKDILSIPGIELTSMEGTHILIYFYAIRDLKKFYRNDVRSFMGSEIMSPVSLKMEEIIKSARGYKTMIVFPHPYSVGYTGIQNPYFTEESRNRLLKLVDAIEVINAENMHKWNLRSALLGLDLNKGITGGSDGHRVSQMGNAVTYARCKPNRRVFLDAIRASRTRVIGKEIDLIRKFTSNALKLRASIRNYPDLIAKNIKYSCALINLKTQELEANAKLRFNGKNKVRRRRFEIS